ncbi:MAG: hypothetical protein GF353_28410 [Candidatus Lokiarchaeota archaeon]|nr:hypothetical protein [Candidatus Lokiarchaeota archaeon]
MDNEGLNTTVVGSFPLSNSKENMTKAFDDMINLGIDYVCYPQLIGMNDQFLSPLSEIVDPLTKEKEKFFLSSDFKVPEKPFALEYGKFILDFFKKNPNLKERIKGTKACLTGPFTLSSDLLLKGELSKGITPQIFTEPRAIRIDWIIDKLAEVMKNIGKAYNDMGIDIISMDEPILGLLIGRKIFFHSKEFIIETLNKVLSGIKSMSSIHVCGRISNTLRDILLQTDVKIMDHEFRTSEANFKIFQKENLTQNDKILAMGAIQTSFSPKKDAKVEDYVESIEFIKKFVQKGIDLYGKENLFVKPDCGFGALKDAFEEDFAYQIAMKKLNNMVLAVKELKNG